MKKQYFINANIIDPYNSMNENGGLIISEDGKTTGIIINLKSNPNIKELKFKNNNEVEKYKDLLKEQNHKNILEIRKVIKLFC